MMDYCASLGSVTHQSLHRERWSLFICKGFLRGMNLETPDNKPRDLHGFLKERTDAPQMFYSKTWLTIAPN